MRSAYTPLGKVNFCQLTRNREWLLLSFGLELNLRIDLFGGGLSALIDGLLRQVLWPELRRAPLGGERSKVTGNLFLENIKGRDPTNFISETLSESRSPDHELFLLQGSLPSAQDGSEAVPFSVRATTPFGDFPRAGKIRHQLHIAQSGELPEETPISALGSLIPVRPSSFRFGLDFFQSGAIASWFGGTPAVTQTLLVEADENHAALRISAEQLRTKDLLPLSDHQTLEKLTKVLGEAFNFDLGSALRTPEA